MGSSMLRYNDRRGKCLNREGNNNLRNNKLMAPVLLIRRIFQQTIEILRVLENISKVLIGTKYFEDSKGLSEDSQ